MGEEGRKRVNNKRVKAVRRDQRVNEQNASNNETTTRKKVVKERKCTGGEVKREKGEGAGERLRQMEPLIIYRPLEVPAEARSLRAPSE